MWKNYLKISKKKYGGKDQIQKLEKKRRPYHHGQNNGITILLGVKDLKIKEVTEYEEKIVVKSSIEKKNARPPDQ